MVIKQSGRETIPKKTHSIWPDWYSKLKPYQVSNSGNAIWQLINTRPHKSGAFGCYALFRFH